MRKRGYKINVFLSDEEKQMLKDKAAKTGLTYSTLIRFLIEGYSPKEKPPDEFYDSLNWIRRTGNLLNQMATKMNYLGYVEDVRFLRKTVNNLNNLILNIKDYYLKPEKDNSSSV